MTKKTTSLSNLTAMNYVLAGLAVVVFVGFALLAFKYVRLKLSWHMYASQMLESTNKKSSMDSAEDAAIIATTITAYPVGSPLYTQARELQQYVAALSKQTGRDIVVMDKNKVILADTVPTNIGKKFMEDKAEEVTKTIADGQTRSFMEKSTDYPQSVSQTAIQLKNTAGSTVGAVVMSTSHLFD